MLKTLSVNSPKIVQNQKIVRQLNLVAAGEHHLPYLDIGGTRLAVSSTVKPQGRFTYTFSYEPTDVHRITTCPCVS
jgi:hypothetical protein